MSVFVLSATLNNLIYKNMWIPRNYLCKMSLYKQKCTKKIWAVAPAQQTAQIFP